MNLTRLQISTYFTIILLYKRIFFTHSFNELKYEIIGKNKDDPNKDIQDYFWD